MTRFRLGARVFALIVGMLLTGGASISQASSISVLSYWFTDYASIDTDSGHVYTAKAPGDSCWTDAVCLSTYDVIVAGDQLNTGAQIVADLSNPIIQAVTKDAGGRAVLGQLFRRTGDPAESQLWTQSVEWAGTGAGVGWVSAWYTNPEYNFTPFAPAVDLAGSPDFNLNSGIIVDSSHPIVAGLTDADMDWTVKQFFDLFPAGFGLVAGIRVDDRVKATLLAADFDDPVVTEVPEPLSLVLLGTGVLGLCHAHRRRQTKNG